MLCAAARLGCGAALGADVTGALASWSPPSAPRSTDVGEKWKKKYGFAGTDLGEEAAKTYAKEIAALEQAMHATRTPDILATRSRGGGSNGSGAADEVTTTDAEGGEEAPTGKKEKEDRNYVKAVCKCSPPAVIRVSPKTLESRSMMCGDCAETFAPAESA